MKKKVLIMYWHGLGDLICLTPQLRHLHINGYTTDLLVRRQAVDSSLLKNCPYVDKVISLPFHGGGPSEGGESGRFKKEACLKAFENRSKIYDYAIKITTLHKSFRHPGGKILRNSSVLLENVPVSKPSNLDLEVFISKEAELEAKEYIHSRFPRGYLFKHTSPEFHPAHHWDASDWIKSKGWNNLKVFEPDSASATFKDINTVFVLAREAKHRILSSSVFVHACDAMKVSMDVVYYGKPNPHGLPVRRDVIQEYLGSAYDD